MVPRVVVLWGLRSVKDLKLSDRSSDVRLARTAAPEKTLGPTRNRNMFGQVSVHW